jgi:hypothetical protein
VILAVVVVIVVPVWLCALGILTVVPRKRRWHRRRGAIPVRVRRPGKRRWTRGHAIWASDVFAWRAGLGGWNEDIRQVIAVTMRAPGPTERKKLRRLAYDIVIAHLACAEGGSLEVATSSRHRMALLGPFLWVPELT